MCRYSYAGIQNGQLADRCPTVGGHDAMAIYGHNESIRGSMDVDDVSNDVWWLTETSVYEYEVVRLGHKMVQPEDTRVDKDVGRNRVFLVKVNGLSKIEDFSSR